MNTIFSYPKFTSCVNYQPETSYGFTLWELPQTTEFTQYRKQGNHLFFVLSGRMDVSCDQFKHIIIHAGELLLLPASSDCSCRMITPVKAVIFAFDTVISLCDRHMLRNLAKNMENLPYSLRPFPIKEILEQYLNLLILFLRKGINCNHFQEEKFKELFIIFRFCYDKKELAELFYPLISCDIDFKSNVLNNYLKASTAKSLAKSMGYTVSDFRNKFFLNFGQPVYQWMQEQKKNKLLFRLKTDDINLSTLAEEYGFSSVSHLNKFCKTQFGMPPSELKEILRREEVTSRI